MSSIVIDTCVMRLYEAPLDPKFIIFFQWVNEHGTLYVSNKLLNEYIGTGNRNLQILLSELVKNNEKKRLITISKNEIESFSEDKHYQYTCNEKDIYHSKLVFLTPRKKMISQDIKIVNDINNFKKVNGIKPEARKIPDPQFYE